MPWAISSPFGSSNAVEKSMLCLTTNERAVRLWRACGFETVGRLPKAFDHPARGLVDALVMFRWLDATAIQLKAEDT